MADVKPLKLEDVGGGRGELREFGASDTVPPSNLPDNVKALANLTGAADRLPYFTGAGALSLATLTSLARNLLDDTTQSGMQSTLGLGTASTRTALGTTGALYSRDSILGTVSQSGGVPTGAIIECGSNANGEYVRWADGTQMCWAHTGVDLSVGQTTVHALYNSVAFVGRVHSHATCNSNGYALEVQSGMEAQSSAGAYLALTNKGPNGNRNVTIFFLSIGRWY